MDRRAWVFFSLVTSLALWALICVVGIWVIRLKEGIG